MLISAREVARHLQSVGLSRPQANRVMASGLVGPSVREGQATLYERDIVEGLLRRERVSEEFVDTVCPHGLFIARRMVDIRLHPLDQLEALRVGWGFSPVMAFVMRQHILRHGFFPLVATVGGFVVCGADIVDVLPHSGKERLELHEPRRWFRRLATARLEAGPGRDFAIRNYQWTASRVGGDGRQLRPRPTY